MMSISAGNFAQNVTANPEDLKPPRDMLTIDEVSLRFSIYGLFCLFVGSFRIRELSYIWLPERVLCLVWNWVAGWMAARLIYDVAQVMFNSSNNDYWLSALKNNSEENLTIMNVFELMYASFILCFFTWFLYLISYLSDYFVYFGYFIQSFAYLVKRKFSHQTYFEKMLMKIMISVIVGLTLRIFYNQLKMKKIISSFRLRHVAVSKKIKLSA